MSQELKLIDFDNLTSKQRNVHLRKCSIHDIENLITSQIEYNIEYNKGVRLEEHKKIDYNSKTITMFFKIIDKIRGEIENKNFTNIFEQCMKMKIFLLDSDEISTYIRNPKLNRLLHAYSFNLTTKCFEHLEKLEALAKNEITLKILE